MKNNSRIKSSIKIGLIGVGAWGKNYIKTIKEFSNIELVAILRNSRKYCKEAPENCKIFTSFDDFITHKKMDGIIVSSPANTHGKIAMKLIEKNIPIIIEKPLTTSVQESNNLLNLAKQKSSIVLVDHIFLYHPIFILLNEYIKSLENIDSIESIGGNLGPYREDITPLWDWAPHDIAMCLTIMESNPIEINAKKISKKNNSYNNSENIKINLIFENQTKVNILVGNDFKNKKRIFTVNNKSVKFVFNPFSQNKLTIKNLSNKKFKNISLKNKNLNKLPLNNLIEHFYKLIILEESNIDDLKLSVNVVNILNQIDKIISKDTKKI